MSNAFDWGGDIRARLQGANVDPASEVEIIDELSQHLEDHEADLIARGMTRAEARKQLLAELDDPASRFPHGLLSRQRARRERESAPIGARPTVAGFFTSVWHDLAYGARGLARAPGLTTVIVLSLGIVIGANTAIFGLLDSLLLKRLPIPHPEQLVGFRPLVGGNPVPLRYPDYKTLKTVPGLPKFEAYVLQGATVAVGNDHADLWIQPVTGGYFDLIGVSPLFGRAISLTDVTTSVPVAVVSEDYWQQHFASDRSALGKTITINGTSFTVIGVMPNTFRGIFFAHAFSVAIPITAAALYDNEVTSRWSLNTIARVDHGVADTVAASRFAAAFFRLTASSARPSGDGSRADTRPRVTPADAPYFASGGWGDTLNRTPHVMIFDASRGITWGLDLRGPYQRLLVMLMAGVVLLLVIACANVGTLLLARAAARQREFAVRMSLGASRVRMMRQLLTESLELAAAGSVLGLLLSWLGTTVLLHNLPGNALQLGDVIAWRASPAILAFTLLVVVVCTVVAGVWPARRASRADILAPLTGADRVSGHARAWSVEQGLAIAQMSLALVLVTTATLFVTTLRNLERADGGYHNRNVLLARIERDSIGRDAQMIVDALTRIPGVEAAGISYAAPVINDSWMQVQVEVPGRAPLANENPPETNVVTPGYFAGTGIGIHAGREFDAHDVAGGEPVVIVSESFARRYYGDRSPIDQSIIVQLRTRQNWRIIGVANDATYKDLHERPAAMWYLPLAQWNANARPTGTVVVSVRTTTDPVSLAASVRRAIDTAVPGAKIRKISAVGQLLDDALAKERFAAALGGLFGFVALGLAVLGVYGVIAYTVTRRTAEIGIRIALGATPHNALWLVFREALTMAGVGLLIGIPLSFAASRAIASQLFGVQPGDVRVTGATALILAAAGLVAGFIPGRRAARVDPMVALRSD